MAIEIYWNQTADNLLLPHIKFFIKKKKKSHYFILCMIFEEKYFSCYINYILLIWLIVIVWLPLLREILSNLYIKCL